MATQVIAQDPTGDLHEAAIDDDYVLITDGEAHRSSVVVHRLKDGSQTHVITIRGIRGRA